MKTDYNPLPVIITYVPHGINKDIFYPIRITDKEHVLKQLEQDKDGKNTEIEIIKRDSDILEEFKNQFFEQIETDFVLLYVNRNIRRKLPGDVVIAYKTFCDMLTPEQSSKCMLLMHTQPIDENGTDLIAVVKELCPYRVRFNATRVEPMMMNIVYNIADATINIASNEGFGLGTCESIMSGTPIVVNVTGGLQDQCGFKINDKYLTSEDYLQIKTLHDKDIWKNNPSLTHGEWAFPVWPSNRSLQGSPPTPYIFDDRPDYKDVANQIKVVYDLGKEERNRRGLLGREFVTSTEIGMAADEMSRRIISDMDSALKNWTPRRKFSIFTA